VVIAASVVAVLLLASALLTAAVEAAFQVSPSHLRTLQEEGFEGAEDLARVREERHVVRSSVRLVSMVFDLAAVGIVTLQSTLNGGLLGGLIGASLGVVLVVLGADLVPHAVAARRPVRLALSSARLLLGVAGTVGRLTSHLTRLEDRSGQNGDDRPEHRDLREIQELGEEEGVLEEGENRLVERAFRLDELTAWDVMVPRVDIFAWKEGRTLDEVVTELDSVPYSRVPVYRETVDDVTGIVYVREVYARYARGDRDVTLGALAREPFFVPGSLSLTQLLQDFQARRIHMGIVADEFGGTDGLVTLEDILEELVGEIHDETDVAEEEILHIADDVVEVDASVDVRDIDDALGVALPKVEHRSLNGFILEELGHVPPTGETFERANVKIEILEATETQVLRARLTRLVATGASEE
jgi:CBS domain containing-hemolysin-like protein